MSDAKWGYKLDNVTPKQKPGRKPTKQPKVYIMPGFDSAGNVVNAEVIKQGRPGEEKLRHRRVVTLPLGETYDYHKHGIGERDPADDIALQAFLDARTARENAAKTAATAPANPVSTEVTVAATTPETVTV